MKIVLQAEKEEWWWNNRWKNDFYTKSLIYVYNSISLKIYLLAVVEIVGANVTRVDVPDDVGDFEDVNVLRLLAEVEIVKFGVTWADAPNEIKRFLGKFSSFLVFCGNF